MSDTVAGASGSINEVYVYLTVLVPLAIALLANAGNLAQFGLQKRISQAEYHLQRLGLVEKALKLKKTLGNKLPAASATKILLAEYHQVVSVIDRMRARQEAEAAVAENRKQGLGALILPWPLSAAGWIFSGLCYVYWLAALAHFAMAADIFFYRANSAAELFLKDHFAQAAEHGDIVRIILINLVEFGLIGWIFHYLAVRDWTKHSIRSLARRLSSQSAA